MKLHSTYQRKRGFTLIELLLSLFLGLLILGVFVGLLDLSNSSIRHYEEREMNEIDYARDFIKREIEFSDKLIEKDRATYKGMENNFGFYLYRQMDTNTHNYSYYSFDGKSIKRYAMNLPYYTENPEFSGGGVSLIAENIDDVKVDLYREASLLEIFIKCSGEERNISLYLGGVKYEK